jgi:quercetin dioxygenase-like cupin family protein
MAEHAYLRTHDLEAEHMLLDLGEVVSELHTESEPGQTRRAVTLVKQGGMSVVLMHLHAGGTLQEHSTPGAATVQILDGHVRMQIGDESIEAASGRLVAFNSRVAHSVEAVEDSTLLLTLVGPAA